MRKTDTGTTTYSRAADRLFRQNGLWFFYTRHTDCGPFSTRERAQQELTNYLEGIARCEHGYFKGTHPRLQA